MPRDFLHRGWALLSSLEHFPYTPRARAENGRVPAALLGFKSRLGVWKAFSAPWDDLFASLYRPLSATGSRLSNPLIQIRPLAPH